MNWKNKIPYQVWAYYSKRGKAGKLVRIPKKKIPAEIREVVIRHGLCGKVVRIPKQYLIPANWQNLVIAWSSEGYSLRQIARMLNDIGIKVSHEKVRSILLNSAQS